ncbi:MAG: trigger factor [Prochloron sp. SP5CPC1]|nr:trigger factor [Candidatus Paraprochloron terpiosi SP5CPC1]
MKVIQEKLPASQIGLEIEIDGSSSQKTYDKVVRELARSTNIPGFRKGKVPRHILLQRIGLGRIKAAALEEIVQKSLEGAIKEESIDSIGNLKLLSNFSELIGQYKPGEPLTFSASVDVAPDVELGDYHSMKVKAEEIVADPSQVDDFLAERQQEQATLVPVEDRPALMGDVATIDFKGRFAAAEGEEGELIPGAEAQDFEVEVAKGKLIEGLIEGIVGMRTEETKEVAVTFPEDYAQEDLAGKAAVFTIVLKELKEKELPELDDDLAEEVSEFETMVELRQSLIEKFSQTAARETKNNIHEAIIAQLRQCCSVQLPETMIEKEVENLLTRSAIMIKNYGFNIQKMFNADTIPVMRERSRQDAIENLQKSLFLKKIALQESIAVEPEKVEARIKEVTQQLSQSKQEYDLEQLKNMVEEELLEENTLDWLQEKTKVELVPVGSLSSSETEEKPPETDAVDASALIEG